MKFFSYWFKRKEVEIILQKIQVRVLFPLCWLFFYHSLYIKLFKATKNLKLVFLTKDSCNLDLEEELVVQSRELLKQLHKLIIDHQLDLMKPKMTLQLPIQIEVSKPFKVKVYVLVEELLNKRKFMKISKNLYEILYNFLF